ncbi:MAG: hypothetical protein RL456_2459 [Pseudomonadota bacterium]|jgi:HD-like signal output (HDOD) protein
MVFQIRKRSGFGRRDRKLRDANPAAACGPTPMSETLTPPPGLNGLFDRTDALPTAPKVVHQLLRSFNDEHVNLSDLAAQIGADPVISAKLLRMANSAYFDVQRRIGSVEDALRMFGFMRVRNLVVSTAMTRTYTRVQGVDLRAFWRVSLHSAVIARWLGQRIGQDPDTCFMTGICHGIGHLILQGGVAAETLRRIDAHASWLSPSRIVIEREVLGFHYGDVGSELARRWNFPMALVDALAAQPEPLASPACPTLAALVHLARWRASCPVQSSEMLLRATYPAAVAQRLGLDPRWVPEFGGQPGEAMPSLPRLCAGMDTLLD